MKAEECEWCFEDDEGSLDRHDELYRNRLGQNRNLIWNDVCRGPGRGLAADERPPGVLYSLGKAERNLGRGHFQTQVDDADGDLAGGDDDGDEVRERSFNHVADKSDRGDAKDDRQIPDDEPERGCWRLIEDELAALDLGDALDSQLERGRSVKNERSEPSHGGSE